jgi:uncharacterized small protein (DUF1192 family)
MSDDSLWSKPKTEAAAYVTGSDLSRMSETELAAHVTLLESEIQRLKREIDSRGSVRAAAEAFFRPA